MDEEAISADQARRLRQAMTEARIELRALWMHYFRLGGVVNHVEVDAYLHQALKLPAMQRDLLVQALAELADGHRTTPVPFTWDYPTAELESSSLRPVTVGAPLDPRDPPDPADPPEDPPDPADPPQGTAGSTAPEQTEQDSDGPPS